MKRLAFGAIALTALGLSGAYFGWANEASSPAPSHGPPAPAAAPHEVARDSRAVQAPPALAAHGDAAPSAPGSDDVAAPEPPVEALLPPPPRLPEPTSNPAPEAEQDAAWKTAKTQAIQGVLRSRAERLARDLSERERVGDTAGAAGLRVLTQRLDKQLQAVEGELSELAKLDTNEPR
jgi:hypothetical protein